MSNLLVIIDMQEGFRSPEAEGIILRVKRVAESFSGDVVFSCFKNEEGSKFERDLKWKTFQAEGDREVLEELRGIKAKKFWHAGYTVLDSALLQFIKKGKYKSIYFCGIYTDVCVIKATMDAFDNELNSRVVGNCCASLHGIMNHTKCLESIQHIIGRNNVINL